MLLGSVAVVVKAGPAFEVCSSNIVVLGSVSAVDEVNTGLMFEVFPSTTVLLGSVAAAGEVNTRPQFGIGRSLLEMKGISLILMLPLALFEGALTIATTTATTQIITITVIATIATVAVLFMEEVMVFLVVVVAAVVVVDVHNDNDIDPEESVNIFSCFASEFTQETPQSICSKDVAP